MYGVDMLRSIAVLLFFAVFSAGAADFNKSIDSAKQIYGDKVSSSDLKGKVILLEYWGLN